MGVQSTDKELQSLIKEWEGKKRKIDKELEALYIVMRMNQERIEDTNSERGPRASSYAQELTDAIQGILLSERPLHRQVILARVAERGIYVGGAKPINSIGSYLSTDVRFKNVNRGIWTLTDESLDTESSSNHPVLIDLANDNVAEDTSPLPGSPVPL